MTPIHKVTPDNPPQFPTDTTSTLPAQQVGDHGTPPAPPEGGFHSPLFITAFPDSNDEFRMEDSW